MNKNLTSKDKKDTILEGYNEVVKELQKSETTCEELKKSYEEALNKIEKLSEGKTNTASIVKEKEKEKKFSDAKEISQFNILSPDIIEKFQSLMDSIENKKAELKELFDIEAKASSLEALINAYKNKEITLESSYKEKQSTLEEQYQEKEKEYLRREKELDEKYQEKVKETQKLRTREEEEYEYTKNRERTIEKNKWNDESIKRENILSKKEQDFQERLMNLKEKEDYVLELEEKVKNIPVLLNDLETKCEDKYSKEIEGKINEVNEKFDKEKEWSNKIHSQEVNALKETNKFLENKVVELQNKLDDSYKQVTDIATKTVQSSGIKILEGLSKKE